MMIFTGVSFDYFQRLPLSITNILFLYFKNIFQLKEIFSLRKYYF